MAQADYAAQKYDRNTQGKGSYWKARTTSQIPAYCEGIADFLGISASQCQSSGPGRDFSAGVQATPPAAYDQGVQGKGQKWLARMRAKFAS